MIRIVIGKRDGEIDRFRLSGHADYDDYGRDIICSAMSMLAINTVNSLSVLAEESFEFEQDDDEGLLEVGFDHSPNDKARLLLASFELGVRGVIDQYGSEFVSLVYEADE
ncbi:MAG: ribosomal-processing cysteine protease Prp [Eubacterium sp.]|nr:ribosomal-processing cysteine protease Prp [Eubacterium sp.]